MSDMNKVIVTGVVPGFDNAFHIWNENDEAKTVARITISCQTSRKDDNGHYIDDLIEVTVFGKTATTLKKFVRKGQGLWFEGRLTPSRKRRNSDGTDSLDANGKPIYTGLGFTAFTFGPMRNYAERNQASTAPAAQAPAFDPLAATPAATSTTASSNPASAFDSMADDANWPF